MLNYRYVVFVAKYIYQNVSVVIKILYFVAKINTKPCKLRSRVLKFYWPTGPVQHRFYWPDRKSTGQLTSVNFDPCLISSRHEIKKSDFS